MISVGSGHKTVLAAFSDYKVEFDEAFRFESLLASLRLPDMVNEGELSDDEFGTGAEDEGVWTMRASSMALVNALTMCPDSIEDRVLLRDEFSRRGLNEIIVVSVETVVHVGGMPTFCRPCVTSNRQNRSRFN